MTAAVLLLIISLSAITVQAAPVPALSTTSAGSEVTANVGSSHGAAGCILPNKPYHTAESKSELTSPCISSSPHHHVASIPKVHPPEPIKTEQAEPVALERRRSLFKKLKGAIKKIGHTIKKAVHTVAHVVKTVVKTGTAIAKVGLKLVATAQQFVGKAAQFIPGLPPGASKFLEKSGSELNKVSNAMHGNIGGPLGKVMHGFDEAQKVASYIPRSVMSEMDDFDL